MIGVVNLRSSRGVKISNIVIWQEALTERDKQLYLNKTRVSSLVRDYNINAIENSFKN